MKINNKKITELINKLKLNRNNKKILKEIIEEVSEMIYNYPRIVFYASEDECSEFYLYVIERILKFIFKYDSNKASFSTWFSIVLKSYYINLKNKQKRMYIDTSISLDYTPSENDNTNMLNVISYKEWLKKNESVLSRKIRKFINNLPIEYQVILRLLYYNIDTELLKTISKMNGRTVKENFKIYTKFFINKNKKFNIRKKLETDILLLEKKIFDKKGDKKLENLLNRKKKKYYNNLENISIEGISVLLNKPESTIYNIINNIKKKIKDKFEYLILKEG